MGGPGVAPTVRIYPDLAGASAALAAHLAEVAGSAVSTRGTFSMVLAGGTTPVPLYRCLARRYLRTFPWHSTELYFGDERCVGPRRPESNYRGVREALLGELKISRRRVHRIRGEQRPISRAASEYAREIGPLPPPGTGRSRFDMVLLGIGPDGHTASLFPHSPALAEHHRTVVTVPRSGRPPYVPRITLTLPALSSSGEVCFLVAGAEKATAISAILGGPSGGATGLPAARVRSNGELRWYLDRRAAAGLSGPRFRELAVRD